MVKYILMFISMMSFLSCNINSLDELDFMALLGRTICIDPGHQEKQNIELEPVAPSSSTMKQKVASGTTGIITNIPEYAVNLAIALKLRVLLENYGVTAVMTRMANDINISNIERAKIGNEANADITVHIHADGSENLNINGVSVLIPSSVHIGNQNIVIQSGNAGRIVLNYIVKQTGAKNNGITVRDDITGFNWSEVPTVLVEAGFMTNSREDILLNNEDYQNKIATGILEGLACYFMSN
jgi:N-acetylmuramoyl-L-alanine amidase